MQENNFKGYKIEFTSHAEKELEKLEHKESKKIDEKLKDLIAGKPNVDIKKMETRSDQTYRLRWSKYRIIFEVKRHIITILVVEVSHRKEAYRDY